MNNKARCIGRSLWKIAWPATFLVCFPGALYGQERGSAALPEGEGKQLVEMVCTQCHGLRSTLILREGPDGWRKVVARMVTNGAQLLPEEVDLIVRYLFTHFGPGINPVQTGPFPSKAGQAVSLPAGASKDLVESHCAICHDLGWIVNARKNRADWEAVTKDMMARGPGATPEQIQTIVSYLTTHFGKGTD